MSNGNGHRWSKFFWRDWSADKALHPCTLAAKGFWIEMLCIMHEGTPVGHLTLNGKPASIRQMAANAYCTEKEAARLLAELEEAGVFSRTDGGTIYCRRMVKDAVASEVGREAADRRWNGARPNGSPNGSPNGKANGQAYGEPNAKKPEAEERPPRSPPVTGGVLRPSRKKQDRNGFHGLDRPAVGPPTIDSTAEEIADFQRFRLRAIGGTDAC